MGAYWGCRTGKAARQSRRTWNTLIISYYNSPSLKKPSNGTQQNNRRHCEAIREKDADKDMTGFRRRDALAVQQSLQSTWSKANERIAVLSILCKHAVDLEWIERNPVTDIEKLVGGEYDAWPDSALSGFEHTAPPGSLARTTYEIAIGTGQRFGDCISMTWADFDGEYMASVQEKTDVKL